MGEVEDRAKASEPASEGQRIELLERLRARDQRAFRAVYEAYRARLFTFLLRLARDEQLARDLSQETWLRLAANVERLSPDSDVGAWLFTVARNLYLSQRRVRALERARAALLGVVGASHALPLQIEQAAASQTQHTLERGLATMPDPLREVVLLVCVEGFSTQQVAHMLDIGHDNVRQRLARGRAHLHRVLREEAR